MGRGGGYDNFLAAIPFGSLLLRFRYNRDNAKAVISKFRESSTTSGDELWKRVHEDSRRRLAIGAMTDLLKCVVMLVTPDSAEEADLIIDGLVTIAAVAIVGQVVERSVGELSGIRFD